MTSDGAATSSRPIPVAILGCTGVVGQKFIALLQGHPYFRIVSLCASERSAGRQYGAAVSWKLSTPLPASTAALTVTTCDVQSVRQTGAEVVFSALDASVAGQCSERQQRTQRRRSTLALLSAVCPRPCLRVRACRRHRVAVGCCWLQGVLQRQEPPLRRQSAHSSTGHTALRPLAPLTLPTVHSHTFEQLFPS